MKIMRKIAVEGHASQTLFEVLSLSPLHNVRETCMYIYIFFVSVFVCICVVVSLSPFRNEGALESIYLQRSLESIYLHPCVYVYVYVYVCVVLSLGPLHNVRECIYLHTYIYVFVCVYV